ncbi:MAG: ABC transporter ATP-binding protein [Halobacteria archaeon]
MADALRLESVTRSFGGPPVLRGLSLALGEREKAAVVGPNGSGKTTLFRIAAGLLRPGAGSVRVFGRDLYADRTARGRVGVAGHEPWLYDALTARENLALYARLRSLGDPPAEELLQSFGVPPDRPVAGFSRGMRQRLNLARALLHRPDLLLLDEPLSHLDAEGRDLVSRTLREFPGAALAMAGGSESACGLGRLLRLEGGRLAG